MATGRGSHVRPVWGAVPATDRYSIFNLVWAYVVKELDKRKKARCTCDGSTRGGQVRVLDYTYANCVDQKSSRIFYAVAAETENLLVYGADVANAFSKAPPPWITTPIGAPCWQDHLRHWVHTNNSRAMPILWHRMWTTSSLYAPSWWFCDSSPIGIHCQ